MSKRPVPYYWIYFMKVKSGTIKIGRTTKIRQRFTSLLGQGYKPEIMVCIATIDYKLEPELHNKFKAYWVKQEYYEPSNELLEYIAMLQTKIQNNSCFIIDGYYDVNLVVNEADISFFDEYNVKQKAGEYDSITGTPWIFSNNRNITPKIGYDPRKYQHAERLWDFEKSTQEKQYIEAGYNRSSIKNLLKADRKEFIRKLMDDV